MFSEWISALVQQAGELPPWVGYLVIAGLIALENVFPPIPSEIILTGGGLLTVSSKMTVLGVLVASTVGSLVGAAVLYGIGRVCSPERLESWLSGKVGRFLGFRPGSVGRAARWFDKHGTGSVLIGRCIPVIRSLISVPAGISGMRPGLFFLLTTAGSLVWNLVLTLAGRLLGDHLDAVLSFFDTYSVVVYLLLGAALAVLIGRWLIKKRKQKKFK